MAVDMDDEGTSLDKGPVGLTKLNWSYIVAGLLCTETRYYYRSKVVIKFKFFVVH